MESTNSLTQAPKHYTPIVSLRERARAAYQAQIESEAAERADVYAPWRHNVTARLVATCAELFHIDVDPADVVTDVIATWELKLTIRASVVFDSIELSATWTKNSPASNRLLSLDAMALCPACREPLTSVQRVATLADIGALIGEVGCVCGWKPGEAVAS